MTRTQLWIQQPGGPGERREGGGDVSRSSGQLFITLCVAGAVSRCEPAYIVITYALVSPDTNIVHALRRSRLGETGGPQCRGE